MSRPSVSVVVPVFNGARSLDELVGRLLEMAAISSAGLDLVEVILVDDASADESWAAIERLAGAHERVRGIALARNFGQHAALLAGIRSTSGEVIVTMDDDLQHLPEEVPTLIAALTSAVDLVYGRPVEEEHGVYRNVTSRVVKWTVSAAAGSATARMSSGFRAFRGWLRSSMHEQTTPFVSLDVMLAGLTGRIAAVPVVMHERKHGQSNYTFGRLVKYALTMLFGFSTLPLRLVSYAGLVLGLVGGVALIYVLVTYFTSADGVPGFAFLASAIAAFSGVQLVALGVIGEYLARMYAGTLGKPAYVVRGEVGRRVTS